MRGFRRRHAVGTTTDIAPLLNRVDRADAAQARAEDALTSALQEVRDVLTDLARQGLRGADGHA